ncbi:MAG TPA: tetratricopeptide repeat protein, partial [Vicinamibacterales bacterium]
AAQLPEQADVHDTLGWAYFKAGRLRSAVAELERAASLDARQSSYQQHLEEARRALAVELQQNKANAVVSR